MPEEKYNSEQTQLFRLKQWLIPKKVVFRRSRGGLIKAVLTHDTGARAEIYLQGAHVASWRTADGREHLFLSRLSSFKTGLPIRGGIPIIFPQFGDGLLPKHGIVRQRHWHMSRSLIEKSGNLTVVLGRQDDMSTRSLWPYAFSLEFSLTLGADFLVLKLTVCNSGKNLLRCQAAFHTYFRVENILRTKLLGLQRTVYDDFLPPRYQKEENRRAVACCRETDRMYINTQNRLILREGRCARSIVIQKQNMPDIVLWNPWIEKSKRLNDLENNAWRHMICVETGRLSSQILLRPGAVWSGKTTLIAR